MNKVKMSEDIIRFHVTHDYINDRRKYFVSALDTIKSRRDLDELVQEMARESCIILAFREYVEDDNQIHILQLQSGKHVVARFTISNNAKKSTLLEQYTRLNVIFSDILKAIEN